MQECTCAGSLGRAAAAAAAAITPDFQEAVAAEPAGVRAQDEGDWVVERIVGHCWASIGSKLHEDCASSSQLRLKVKWVGSDILTDEPVEHFFKDSRGERTLVRDYMNGNGPLLARIQAAAGRSAKCTADCGVKILKKFDRIMAAYLTHTSANFPNHGYGTDLREVELGMDGERFNALLDLRTQHFVKRRSRYFEVHCASDVHDWFLK
jgi:hypothetical protein